ncbi:MAG: hypothetical protein V4673_09480 [Pseudomonadota bacterium]
MKMLAIALSLTWMMCLTACSKPEASETATPSPPPLSIDPIDTSFLTAGFKQCSAKPAAGATLSEAELCWVRTLAVRCDIGDDCIVSCLSAGVSAKIGGGCAHLCSQPPDKLTNWQPPANLEACDAFGKVNGF